MTTTNTIPSDAIAIDVVICTYNNATVLDSTLDCLTKQVVSPDIRWSVLVVSNNCTDHTEQVVASRIQSGLIPGLRMVVETQQGSGHARVRGILETSAEWIAFVDDDNLLDPDWIRQAALFIRAHPQAGVIGGRIELLWESPPPPIVEVHRDGFVRRDYGAVPIRLPSPGVRLPVTAGLLVRRQAIHSSGWPQNRKLAGRSGSSLVCGEDTEMVLRLLKTDWEIWYAPGLRLRHFIVSRRLNFPYVCRLYRGFAESSTILEAIQQPETPGLGWRLKTLLRHLTYLARRTGAFLAWDVIAHRRIQTKRLVQVHEGRGYVLGAWRFLFFGFGHGESND